MVFRLPDALRQEVVAKAQRDHVGLWEVIRAVRRHCPDLSPAERRGATLELLRSLLETGELVAGQPSTDGRNFATWGGSASEIVARIAKAWPEGGLDPNIGDIVWFTVPT